MSGITALRLGELLGVAEPEKENKEEAEIIDFKDVKDEVKDAKNEAGDNADNAKDEVVTVIKEKAARVADKAKDVAEKATEKVKKKNKSTKDDILPGVVLPTSGLDVANANDNTDGNFFPVYDSGEDEDLADLLEAVKDIDNSNDDINDVDSNNMEDINNDADDGAADVIRTEPTEEEEDMAVNMKDMSFYNEAGQKIYDVDRGMPMDSTLRSWIVEQFSKDEELAKSVLKTLPTIVSHNPNKLVPDLKRIIKDTAENNIPYTVTYLDKMTDKEYESREQAEKATEDLRKKLGLKFSDVASLVYREIKDGKLGKKVAREEVEAFVASFDGNREALAKKLQLPTKKDNKSGKSDNK